MSPVQTGPCTSATAAGKILRSPVLVFALIFLLSFTVRAALLVSFANSRENFYRLGSGIEDRVALSLLQTGTFADPYLIPTGPTAHPPPLWPGILALIYSVFGTTPTAGYARGLVSITSYQVDRRGAADPDRS